MHGHGLLQAWQPFIDQVEANMRCTVSPLVAAVFPRGTLAGELDCTFCHRAFGELAVLGSLFYHMAVAITGDKIHPPINAARILAQRLFNQADRFHELAPVHRTQKTQTGDAVADRDLSRGLPLAFRLHQLVDRQVRLGEQSLDPGQRQGQRGTLSLQAPRKFRHERGAHRRA